MVDIMQKYKVMIKTMVHCEAFKAFNVENCTLRVNQENPRISFRLSQRSIITVAGVFKTGSEGKGNNYNISHTLYHQTYISHYEW